MFKLEIFKDKDLVNYIYTEDPAVTEKALLRVYKNYWEYKTKYHPFKSVKINIKPYSDGKEINATLKMYLNAAEQTGPIFTYKYYFKLED